MSGTAERSQGHPEAIPEFDFTAQVINRVVFCTHDEPAVLRRRNVTPHNIWRLNIPPFDSDDFHVTPS
jgi:hypothetical protein